MKSKIKKISLVLISLMMTLGLFDFSSANSTNNVNNIFTISVVKAKSRRHRRYKRKRMSRSRLRKLHHYVYAGRKRIIGNRNSKIYHVPGQAGYRLNVANAVYFKSEQQAIRAGYRRSRRWVLFNSLKSTSSMMMCFFAARKEALPA